MESLWKSLYISIVILIDLTEHFKKRNEKYLLVNDTALSVGVFSKVKSFFYIIWNINQSYF